jgi:hypothetical protein
MALNQCPDTVCAAQAYRSNIKPAAALEGRPAGSAGFAKPFTMKGFQGGWYKKADNHYKLYACSE